MIKPEKIRFSWHYFVVRLTPPPPKGAPAAVNLNENNHVHENFNLS